jgi:hypothetical protein
LVCVVGIGIGRKRNNDDNNKENARKEKEKEKEKPKSKVTAAGKGGLFSINLSSWKGKGKGREKESKDGDRRSENAWQRHQQQQQSKSPLLQPNKRRYTQAFEIRPMNFFSLPDEKQRVMLTRFLQLINAATSDGAPVTLTVARARVGFGGMSYSTVRTFVSTTGREGDGRGTALHHYLTSLGFGPVPVGAGDDNGLPAIDVITEEPHSVSARYNHDYLGSGVGADWQGQGQESPGQRQDDSYGSEDDNDRSRVSSHRYLKCRTFVLLTPRYSIPPAWVHSLLQHCDLVRVRVEKISPERAISMARKYRSTVEVALRKNPDLMHKFQRANALYEGLQSQSTALFNVGLSCTIFAADRKELDARSREFVKAMKAAEMRFADVPFVQRELAAGTWRKKDAIADLGTLAVMYPFVSADLLEVKNGVLLGQNVETGSPVVYDYMMRSNYNMVLLASSGAGKSVTAKTILKRVTEKHPGAYVYVVDPQGEYEKIAGYFGLAVTKLVDPATGKVRRMGLDPYTLFDPLDIPQVIADIAGADDLARKEITAKSTTARSIFDLYSKVSDDTKKHLMQLVEGPFAEIFRSGEPERVEEGLRQRQQQSLPNLQSDSSSGENDNSNNNSRLQQRQQQEQTEDMLARTIISLQGAYDNKERQAILLTLALAKAWKYIISAPAGVPKVLVVDEGWLVFKIPSTARFIEMIARTGRKLNVLFLFISQNPEDVIRQETGRAILENADTKILLRNTEIAAHMVAETMWLSQREKEMLPVLQNGEALMFAGEHRLRVRITPRSLEELRVFSTTPTATAGGGGRGGGGSG